MPTSKVGRALHDVGAAALLGGDLFARAAMHPALAGISDPGERGRVLNRSWRRYGTVNLLGLGAAVAVTGLATAAEASRFSTMREGGTVPLEDGDHVHADATEGEARAKRRVNRLGTANLLAETGLVAVNAALAQEGFRRPAGRRLVPRLGRR